MVVEAARFPMPCHRFECRSLFFVLCAFLSNPQVDFLYNVNSSREVAVLNGMDKRAKLELQLWASYRAQTLARTVRGMMYYEQAVRLLAVVRDYFASC